MTRDIILGVVAVAVLVGGYYLLKDKVSMPNGSETATPTAFPPWSKTVAKHTSNRNRL
jgi:hypothetical protein